MTEEQNEVYAATMKRLRRLGKDNPTEAIIYLAMEVETYRTTIRNLKDELERYQVINKLLEADIADRDKMLESKAEEVAADFMRDYRVMREELEGLYEELEETRKERDKFKKKLEKYKRRRLIKFENIDEVHALKSLGPTLDAERERHRIAKERRVPDEG